MDLLTTYTHPLGTASKYITTPNLHTLQITVANTKSSPAVPCQGLLTVEILQLPALMSFLSGEYPATEFSQFHSAGLGSSLYSPGADPTENTAPNSSSIVAMGGCLAIARILLTCLSAVTKQQLLSCCLFLGICLSNGSIRLANA
jgi:hypothetical protein